MVLTATVVGGTATKAEADYRKEVLQSVHRVHKVEHALNHKLTPYYGNTDWQHKVLWHKRKVKWNRKYTPWTYPWFLQSQCIHRHEGAYNDNTGNGYYGGFQFLLSTWASVNYNRFARPDLEAPHIQRLMAHRVWSRDGGSWSEWGTAGMCGVS